MFSHNRVVCFCLVINISNILLRTFASVHDEVPDEDGREEGGQAPKAVQEDARWQVDEVAICGQRDGKMLHICVRPVSVQRLFVQGIFVQSY